MLWLSIPSYLLYSMIVDVDELSFLGIVLYFLVPFSRSAET
jgi:hypothetical protein